MSRLEPRAEHHKRSQTDRAATQAQPAAPPTPAKAPPAVTLAPPSKGTSDMELALGTKLTGFLGCFSIALGAIELLFPRSTAHTTGVHNLGILRLFGVREILTGVGILAANKPEPWIWGRVAGDLLDLGVVHGALMSTRAPKRRAKIATSYSAVLGALAMDVACAVSWRKANKNRRG